MNDFTERRSYHRCAKSICRILISCDKTRWDEIDFCDISAGGLKFGSSRLFTVGEHIFLHLSILSMLSEFNMEFEGVIVRKEESSSGFLYGVKYFNPNKYYQIQLDEIIKSRISVNHDAHSAHEDGIYDFLFRPRTKSYKSRQYTYK